jgi:hypothetical protein
MEPLHERAIGLINRVTRLAQNLADVGMVVMFIQCDWGLFGLWRLEVERKRPLSTVTKPPSKQLGEPGPDILRAVWDGRDGVLTFEISPTRYGYGPNDWSKLGERSFGTGTQERKAALVFAERYFLAWNQERVVEGLIR